MSRNSVDTPLGFYLYSQAPKETTDQAAAVPIEAHGAEMPGSTTASQATPSVAKRR